MLCARPGSGGCWQSTVPTLHPRVINQSPRCSQHWNLCSLPHGWMAPGLVGHAHALAHGCSAKIIPIALCKSSYLCAGRDRTWRLKGSKFLLLSPCSLSPGSPCIVPRHPGHGSHSPRPPSMIPMEPRLANPQSAKVAMFSARSWRAQWQGLVTSAQEQPQSTQR